MNNKITNVSVSDKKNSEFVNLIYAMKDELSSIEDTSLRIKEKINTIKYVCETQPSIQNEPYEGILGELWECVARLRNIKDTLYLSNDGLTQLVG